MMSSVRRREEALDRFWDAALRNHPTEMQAADVAPDEAALIARLQALAPAALFPNPEHAWRDLLHRQPALIPPFSSAPSLNNRRAPEALATGSVGSWPHPPPALGGRALRFLATALLVLATLALAYVAFGPGRPHPAVIPTVLPIQVATPAAGVTVTLLGSGTVDALPAEPSWLMTFHSTFRPGGRYSKELSEGPDLIAVRSGAMTYHADQPITVLRAVTEAGPRAREVIPPDSDAVLQTGDAAVIPMGANVSRRNDGTEPAVEIMTMLEGTFLGSRGRGAPTSVVDLPIVTFHISDAHALPPAPATITLSQVALAPGAQLAPPDAEWWMIGTSEDDYASLEQQPDGTMVNTATAPIALYLTTVESSSGGTPMP